MSFYPKLLISIVAIVFAVVTFQNFSRKPQHIASPSRSVANIKSTVSGPPSVSTLCSPLPLPTEIYKIIGPNQAAQLPKIIADAPPESRILLQDGVYNLDSEIRFTKNGVTLQSQSQDADSVILDGRNGYSGKGSDTRVPELIRIAASNILITDITLRYARDHVIHVSPAATGSTGVKLHRLKILNAGEQAVKVDTSGNAVFTDYGFISCSQIELQDSARPWVEANSRETCSAGGVDIQQARGWTIRNNLIRGFWCPSGLAEYGIHIWSGSRDSVVENNNIKDCARGIGFGQGAQVKDNSRRNYTDNPCDGASNAGHYNGRIINNVIYAKESSLLSSRAGFKIGIGLEDVCGGIIAHNTIYSAQSSFASIDQRFGRSPALKLPQILNNFTSHRISERDGAKADIFSNSILATSADFVSVATEDFHLKPTNTNAANRGGTYGITKDKDGKVRDGTPDLGAFEL